MTWPLVVLVAHLGAKGGRIARAVRAASGVFEANGYSTHVISTETTDTPDDGETNATPDDSHITDPHVAASAASNWGAPLARFLAETLPGPHRPRQSPYPPVAAVVAVGGDGMAHLVINVLMDHRATTGAEVPFGLIACGSGNDLARHWDNPRDDPERAAGLILRRLDTGSTPMDLGRVTFETTGPDRDDQGESGDGEHQSSAGPRDTARTGSPAASRWFATAVCAGIDAAVNERANGWRRPTGGLKYLAALAVEVLKHPPNDYTVELTTPGGPVRRRAMSALMVNVANTSSIGGGLRIVPRADPCDGALELFVVKPLTRSRFMRLFPSIYTGAHVHVPQVEISPATRVRIAGEHVVYADGEPLGTLPATVEVVPAALPVLL